MKEELQLAARRDDYIENALAMIAAQRVIVKQYLSGELGPDEVVPEP